MKLSECKIETTVIIKNILCDRITKARLELLGICEGVKVIVEKESFGTKLIVFNGKMLALGKTLCEEVEVLEDNN